MGREQAQTEAHESRVGTLGCRIIYQGGTRRKECRKRERRDAGERLEGRGTHIGAGVVAEGEAAIDCG